MSDTPRTDACRSSGWAGVGLLCPQLERELAASQKTIKTLEKGENESYMYRKELMETIEARDREIERLKADKEALRHELFKPLTTDTPPVQATIEAFAASLSWLYSREMLEQIKYGVPEQNDYGKPYLRDVDVIRRGVAAANELGINVFIRTPEEAPPPIALVNRNK